MVRKYWFLTDQPAVGRRTPDKTPHDEEFGCLQPRAHIFHWVIGVQSESCGKHTCLPTLCQSPYPNKNVTLQRQIPATAGRCGETFSSVHLVSWAEGIQRGVMWCVRNVHGGALDNSQESRRSFGLVVDLEWQLGTAFSLNERCHARPA